MKPLSIVRTACLCLWLIATTLWANPQPTSLVTQVDGEVALERGGEQHPAAAFEKLPTGTVVDVGTNATFQLVYLASGRQETWRAGSKFQIGNTASKPLKIARFPAVKQLPSFIVAGLNKAPSVVASLRSRQGMVRVRAVGDWQALDELQSQYRSLREQSRAEDITPELFLLASLADMKLVDEMKAPLDEMLKRQPDNPVVRDLHEAYLSQAGAGTGD
jgi:hypothetical protein